MITLDEVIEQERKKAEMYRCEYECDCDYYGKDFVDDHADEFECIKNMREHEQLADWLEELKVYQHHEIICNKGYNSGYNKALDDFYNALANDLIWIKEKFGDDVYTDLGCDVGTRAEQLKAAGRMSKYKVDDKFILEIEEIYNGDLVKHIEYLLEQIKEE